MGINTRDKMYWVNSKIKDKLKELGYTNIYLFPHLRFQKDYIIDDCKFDGIATSISSILLFQNKSNKKPSKIKLEKMREVGKKYNFIAAWFVYEDRKGVSVIL